jgi:hypothetical protein
MKVAQLACYLVESECISTTPRDSDADELVGQRRQCNQRLFAGRPRCFGPSTLS